jgi:hypothetical protein
LFSVFVKLFVCQIAKDVNGTMLHDLGKATGHEDLDVLSFSDKAHLRMAPYLFAALAWRRKLFL